MSYIRKISITRTLDSEGNVLTEKHTEEGCCEIRIPRPKWESTLRFQDV